MCNGRTPGTRALTEQLDAARRRTAQERQRCAALEAQLAEAVAELRDREARTQMVLDTANDAFFTADIAGRVTAWNTAAEQLFGVATEQALGRSVDRLLAPVSGEPDPSNPLSDVLTACGDGTTDRCSRLPIRAGRSQG